MKNIIGGVLAFAASVAIPALAEQIGVQDDDAKTYTITVAEGVTVALSAEDAAALQALTNTSYAGYTFVKDGPGTLSVDDQLAEFNRDIVITNGTYEATTSDSLGKGGEGANTFVREGASLRLAHFSNTAGKLVFKYNETISIAGAGYGGAGAIYNALTADQTALLRNNGHLVLDGDATIRGYCMGFGANADNNAYIHMNGYTLTVDMKAKSEPFNFTFTEVKTAGDIHVVRGRFFFSGDTVFTGGSENTVTVDGGNDLAFRNTTTPIPWSLVLAGGANLYPSSPWRDAEYDYNVWSGPVTLNGNVLLNYSQGPTSVAFAGPVGGPGGFTVNRTNTLHLASSANTFRGGVSVAGHTTGCKLVLKNENSLPPDGGPLSVRHGTVVLDSGVRALPEVKIATQALAVLSNTVPGSVVQVPNLSMDGTGTFSMYGGIAVTNTFSVNTGKVELAGFAVDPACVAGLYRAYTNFAAKTDVAPYVSANTGVTLASGNKFSDLRKVYNHIINTYESTVVTEISDAASSWSPANRLGAYSGYFHNNEATNVTYTFAMSIADIAALWIDGNGVLKNVGSKKVKVDGSSKTYFVTLGTVTLAPGPHKFDVLMGHFTTSSSGPRSVSYPSVGLNWESSNGFMLKYGAIDPNASTNSADYTALQNGTEAFGTVLTTTPGPLASRYAANPELFRPTFANLAGAGRGTLDLGGETHEVETLGGTLEITNGALSVSGDWGAALSSIALAPLTVAANATLTFGANVRFVPDEALQHGGHTARVVARTSDGGAISGMPRCDLKGWSLLRTDDGGETRIEARYAIGTQMILR